MVIKEINMANWGDTTANAFSGAFQNSREMANRQQQLDFEKWKAQQVIQQQQLENQINLAKARLVPNSAGQYMVGGQNYSQQPPVMPDLSQMNLGGMQGGNGSINALGLTGMTLDPMTGDVKLAVGQTPESKIAEKTEEKKQGNIVDVETGSQAVINSYKNLVSSWKAMRNTAGGAGRVAGIGNMVSGLLGENAGLLGAKVNPFVQPFEGLKNDSAVALAKIINPSGRGASWLIQQLKKNFPSMSSTDQETEQHIRNGVYLSLGRLYSANGKEFTDAEKKKYEPLIQQILGVEPTQNTGVKQPADPGIDVRTKYNQLRQQGISAAEAKKRLGL